MIKYLAMLVIVIGGVGFVLVQTSSQPQQEAVGKNVDLMDDRAGLAILSDDVEYLPGVIGRYARPQQEGKYPGVVMIHENRGLRPEIKDAADALAKEGYRVLAVNLLGGTAEDQDGARALTAQFDQARGVENMRAAAAFLRQEGSQKLASLGWCFGGRQSVELAISGEPLDATIVYYGGGMATSTERLKPITWPVLGIFGDQDRVIPLEMVDAFRSSLETLGVTNEIYVYPGVGHAFANPSGANYAPTETADAWEKTLGFLEAHLR
jgi:carboxymethylenebutenolidase